MKKLLLCAAASAVAGTTVFAQEADSVRMIRLQEVEVTSTRATETTPMAFSDVSKKEISENNFGQDLPFLLQTTPSVVATSEAGAGIGYTGIRVRGTDATRINITANGIPMNDAESHGLFWVNMPDMASSLEDIQIQRGVGTSTNGAGAFGASLNMRTESLSSNPFGEISGSYGSYNTHRETIKFGTGLIAGKWAFNVRLSNIHTDGYIDRASVDLKSYFAQGAWYGKNTVVKLITFAGKEKTYHAWNGISKSQLHEDRRYNPSGEMYRIQYDEDGFPIRKSDGSPRKELAGFYKDQTDNYTQYNYQVHVSQYITDRWSLNAALHFTDGEGYYEEYKDARTLTEYGLEPFAPADPLKEPYIKNGMVHKSDLIRRKMMDNWFGGGIFSLDYKADRLAASLGGGANHYYGDHFGHVTWVKNYAADPGFYPNHKYYDNTGKKTDINVYLKADWEVARGLHLFGDVQYRHIKYTIEGENDRWDWSYQPDGRMQVLDVHQKYDFFNPKAGLLYNFSPGQVVYASFAVAHKEPSRNNFKDADFNSPPTAERLFDWEAGYNYTGGFASAGLNLYYMDYKDQLILTGEVNQIGEPLAANVPDSYRMGIEITAGFRFTEWLRWDLNATFSRNKIKDYTEYLVDYDENWKETGTQTANYLGTTTIAYSPSIIVGSVISAEFGGWNIAFVSNFVSRQYLTNSEQDGGIDLEGLYLPSYFVNNLRGSYTFKLRSVKSLSVGVTVNNIFNRKYCSNGWGGSSNVITADGGYRYNEGGYFPQATTNVLAHIAIRF